jgi:hypothetical protein
MERKAASFHTGASLQIEVVEKSRIKYGKNKI